ncbi:dipeptidyl peptidase IV [Psychroflexus torquis ATCC 700755]|uniref:Dipeptidyl peptidase IV n=1 Tax=Psychroflexus torquis (strain ATCC 700755 / CIP 106069 / ACAM 623) TaxID=313595 RepID=K4IES9_PSYTT|nr:S9 family peptidase [Psychroflexus torquis]AFU69042.1 dipeptidyl peptidase IV [Psychroflexus torquis ATCC 700755]
MKSSRAFIYFLYVFLTYSSTLLYAQNKEITLEEIWGGEFSQERMQSLQSLKDGKSYIVQDYDAASQDMKVEIYSYKTGEKTGTLVSSKSILGLDMFQTFQLSTDETQLILGTEVESIFRRSSQGIYYVYDLSSKSLSKIDEGKIQSPTFSPKGGKVAYVKNNNIYSYFISTGETTQITSDGKKNEVINGVTDWVYEEEFAFVRAFEWSPNGNQMAFLRFDESEVAEFSMDLYGTYGQSLYPSQDVFKYPKAGEDNAKVSLHLFDFEGNSTSKIDLGEYEYLPRLKWTADENLFSVQSLNRYQNELKVYLVDTKTNEAKLTLTEKDTAYVDVTNDLTFLNNNSFIWTSEKDGWKHIYHYAQDGSLINQVTSGAWEVTKFYGFDDRSGRIYFQSTENGSVNRDVYSVLANAKNKLRLTTKTGTNRADFSADFTYFVNTFTNTATPAVYTLHKASNGEILREIKDNKALLNTLEAYNLSDKELSTIEVNGNELNMWMIKPPNFNPENEYPILMFQYSGPGSQSVSNSFFGTNDYWYQMLAQQGYIVACVDGRGTGYKGRDFKKVTQKELGKYELEDQISAAKLLGEKPFINKDRIGIWGWSYGGFMSSNAIFQANDVFKAAIAVAPVTSWRFYDTVYTERYMTTPQENAAGYDENSPITHVDEFNSGNYLLVHGSADDNVHVQNTMQLIEALVQANKQFEWRIYPDKNHGIYGGNTRLHLYTLMTNFIKEKL